MFGINRVEFRERQENAMRRALRATRLTTKEIAYAVGVDGDTILSWSKGGGTLNGAALESLDRLFCSVGYYGFIEDIFGQLFALRRQRADELEQQAAKLRSIGSLAMAAA